MFCYTLLALRSQLVPQLPHPNPNPACWDGWTAVQATKFVADLFLRRWDFFFPASPILLAAGAGLRLSGSNSAFLDAEDHGDGGDCVLILAWRTR